MFRIQYRCSGLRIDEETVLSISAKPVKDDSLGRVEYENRLLRLSTLPIALVR